MLENTIWRKYHNDNNFKEILGSFYGVDTLDIIDDEKDLYGVLKAKLTKKELKLFAMDSAGLSDEEIKEAFSLDDEALSKAKEKLYKKLKQDKLRYAFRASANDTLSEPL